MFIYYYFCQFQVISVTIVGFSFFNGMVPTTLSTCVVINFVQYDCLCKFDLHLHSSIDPEGKLD